MNLYIRQYDNYRRGSIMTVLDFDNEEYRDDERLLDTMTISDLPVTNEYGVYLLWADVYEYLIQKNCPIICTNDLTYAETILKQLFSDINERQPFVQTGMTCAYKEIGYYPDPLPPLLINGKPLIEKKIKKEIQNTRYDYCVAVIIKNKKLITYQQILPLL